MSNRTLGNYVIKEISGSAEHLPEIVETGNILLYNQPYMDKFVLKVEELKEGNPRMKKFTVIDELGHLAQKSLYDSTSKYFQCTTILDDYSKKYEIFGEEKTAEEWRKIIFD